MAGAGSCSSCASGVSCSSTTASTTVACTAGTYSVGAQASCTSCAPGEGTLDDGCYFMLFLLLYFVCNLCPTRVSGQQCPNLDGSGISQCLPGSYSVGGVAVCTQCTIGNYCPYTTLNVVLPCPAGSYSAASKYKYRGGYLACTHIKGGWVIQHVQIYEVRMIFGIVYFHLFLILMLIPFTSQSRMHFMSRWLLLCHDCGGCPDRLCIGLVLEWWSTGLHAVFGRYI